MYRHIYYGEPSVKPFQTHAERTDLMSETIMEIDDDNFDAKVTKSDKPVVVDFWAPWCGPCRAIAPTVEALAEIYEKDVNFFKCNVDDNPLLPSKFDIKSIPTLIFFKNGQVADQIVGRVDRTKIETCIKNLIA